MKANSSDEVALREFLEAMGHEVHDPPDCVRDLAEKISAEDVVDCDKCGHVTFDGALNRTAVDPHGQTERICRSCSSDYSDCDVCGAVLTDSVRSRPQLGEGDMVCDACYVEPEDEDDEDEENDEDKVSRIHGYNERVELILGMSESDGRFQKLPDEILKPNPRWLGVELEVMIRSDRITLAQAASRVEREIDGFAVMKQDSSITANGGYGFEIVSLPGSLSWHKQAWLSFLESAANYLQAWNAPTCGMHVHIDRASMSTLGIGKLLVFVTAPENVPFIERIAGRKGNIYTAYNKKKVTDVVDPMLGNGSRRHRRDAINLNTASTGYRTMELRIFRANVARDGFFKNLEFADAACEFCETAASVSPTVAAFVEWMKQPRNLASYPYLSRWLSDHGVFTHPNQKVKVMKRWSEASLT